MKNVSGNDGRKALIFLILIIFESALACAQAIELPLPPPPIETLEVLKAERKKRGLQITERLLHPFKNNNAPPGIFQSGFDKIRSYARASEDEQWEKLHGLSEGGIAEDIVNVNGRLFINQYSELYISDDNGKSWHLSITGMRLSFKGYAANYYYGTDNRILVSGNNILFMNQLSTDGGDTWSEITIDPSTLPSIHYFTPTVLSIIGTDFFLGTWYNGMFKSTDQGKTFVAINTGFPTQYGYHLTSQAICELDGGPLVATPLGIYWYDGNTWMDYTGTGLPQHIGQSQVSFYVINSLDVWNSGLVASTNMGVYHCSHPGGTWTKFDLPDIHAPESIRKTFLPQVNWPPVFYNVDVIGDELYTTYSNDIYTTTDGNSWIHNGLVDRIIINKVVSTDDSTVIMATRNGIYTLDSGVWKNGSPGFERKNFHTIKNNGTQAMMSSWGGGIFRTTDNGKSWKPFNDGLDSYQTSRTFFDDEIAYTNTYKSFIYTGMMMGYESIIYKRKITDDKWTVVNDSFPIHQPSNIILAGNDHYIIGMENHLQAQGIYHSGDRGETWEQIFSGVTNNYYREDIVASICHDNDTLYAGTLMSGIFRSGNKGQTWTPINSGLVLTDTSFQNGDALLTILAIEKHENRIYFLADKLTFDYVVFYSPNWGKDWHQVDFSQFVPDSTICFVHSLQKSLSGQIFVHIGFYNPDWSLNQSGFFTCDEHNVWREFEPVFPELYVNQTETIGSHYYATSGYGVYRTSNPDIIMQTAPEDERSHTSIEDPYPNPFCNMLSININLRTSSPIDITLIDTIGRKLAHLQTHGHVGNNEVTFSQDLHNGLYYVVVKAGEKERIMRVIKEDRSFSRK